MNPENFYNIIRFCWSTVVLVTWIYCVFILNIDPWWTILFIFIMGSSRYNVKDDE